MAGLKRPGDQVGPQKTTFADLDTHVLWVLPVLVVGRGFLGRWEKVTPREGLCDVGRVCDPGQLTHLGL